MKKFVISAFAAVTAIATVAFGGCDIINGILDSFHTHTMEHVEAVEPTCTQAGNEEYYHCSVCGKNFADEGGNRELSDVTVAALGHDGELVEELAATCTQEGNMAYYICARCGLTFADEACTQPVSADEYATPVIAHTISAEWQHDGANHWHVCTVCGTRTDAAAHTIGDDGACTVCGYTPGENDPTYGSEGDISSADLSIHFLELGNKYTGDSTLIKVGDTEVLIDAGSRQSSAATIKAYIDKYCTDGVLEYVIATHSDQDHIAGLVGTSSGGKYNGVLYSYDIGTVIKFDLSNKDTTTAAGNPTLYGRFLTAVDYAESQGAAVYTGLECWNEENGAQRTYYLDDEQTISINILYNYYYDHTSSDENNYSVCFLLTQELGGGEENNYLFTGDLEVEGEEYLVQYNELPEVELFKAGHHGSPTSSNDVLLSVIRPKNVVVCCCAGSDEYTDNKDNQFPSQAFVDRVSGYTENVYVTTMVSDNENGFQPMNGNVVFYYNTAEGESGGSLKLWCSNNTTKLKDTEWFAANRTWPSGGV